MIGALTSESRPDPLAHVHGWNSDMNKNMKLLRPEPVCAVYMWGVISEP